MFRPFHQAIIRSLSLKLRKLYNVWHKIRILKFFSNIQRDLVFVSYKNMYVSYKKRKRGLVEY